MEYPVLILLYQKKFERLISLHFNFGNQHEEQFMKSKSQARLAVIGLGGMGSEHVKSILENENTVLAAICDQEHERVDRLGKEYNVKTFYDYKNLLNWGEFDGILIATPHYTHTTIAIDAFEKGFHVLTEKPVGVHANDISRMITAWEKAKIQKPEIQFAAMFQQRTQGHWKKIKELIDSGELGKLVRTSWIITDWFRTQHYYDHGAWRATWKGEGGGVLLNQCPHQLDLYQWFVGMPTIVNGFASIGKYHTIEVEDEVTGYFQYENGMVGHFLTSTGESPGTNRLEIVGEMGKIVFEKDVLTFYRNRISMLDQIDAATGGFDHCENWEINIPFTKSTESGHRIIIENFAEAILSGEELLAPAPEGIHSVSLGNAIMLSHFEGKSVPIPLDGDLYESVLNGLIENSTFQKNRAEKATKAADLSSSY
jgi:predicted dehydrogenase